MLGKMCLKIADAACHDANISTRLTILGLVVFLFAANWLHAAPNNLPQLRAQLAAAEKDDDKDAVVELSRRILETTPGDSKLWEKLARKQFEQKDYDRCEATLDHWEKAVKPRPTMVEDLRGDIAFEKEGHKKAEPHWLAFLATKPNRDQAAATCAKLADACVAQSRWAENLEYRTRIVALKENAANRVGRATALLRLHRWDEAYTDINKANSLDSSDATVKEWLPQFERLTKFLPRLKELDAEIAKGPKDAAPLLEQARIFTLADRPLLALENSQKALKLQPDSMRARIQAGEAFLDTNEPDEAAKLQVSSKLARSVDKHVSEGELRLLGETDARLLQNPKSTDALLQRAKILYNLRQFTLGLAAARAAQAVDDKSAAAHFEASHDLDDLGLKKDALDEARKATQLDPNDSKKWLYRGMLEKERADFSAAIESQTRSLAIQESIFALDERADCERRLGKMKEAEADVARLRQLKP
jgi:hypothetical protein